nr:cysteine proteinase EP-B 1-like [Quercus suber]
MLLRLSVRSLRDLNERSRAIDASKIKGEQFERSEACIRLSLFNSRRNRKQLIACAVTNYTFGCNGGLAARAYTYVRDNKGITLEEDYPFHGFQGPCDQQKATQFQIFQISGSYAVQGSEADLLKAVAGQPVSVDINASSREFQLYESGVIFTGPCWIEPNHVVIAVGYGTSEDGIKYWIMKNSWGTGWGEDGYMRILKDNGSLGGLCGLNQQIVWPYVN